MKTQTEQITTSAALFFQPQEKYDFLSWFNEMRHFFGEYNIPLEFFDVDLEGIEPYECHEIAKYSSELNEGLHNGKIRSLGLIAPRTYSGPKYDWKIHTFVWPDRGLFYLGVDQELSDAISLIRRAFEIGKNLIDIRYGIGYMFPLSKAPDCNVFGRSIMTLAQVKEFLSVRNRIKTDNDLWAEEIEGPKRYLTGLFRKAYPANVLSEAHLRAIDLKSQNIGRLTELDSTHWLWELQESEIVEADWLLERKGALVRCIKS